MLTQKSALGGLRSRAPSLAPHHQPGHHAQQNREVIVGVVRVMIRRREGPDAVPRRTAEGRAAGGDAVAPAGAVE